MHVAADYRSMARRALAGRWGMSIAVALVAALLGANYTFGYFDFKMDSLELPWNSWETWSAASEELSRFFAYAGGALFAVIWLLAVVQFIFGGAMMLGLSRYNVALYTDSESPRFAALFAYLRGFGRALALKLLTALFTTLWGLLFVIPGIVAAYRYALAPYLMMENPDMGALEAIRESKRLMAGNKGRLFCLNISFIGWAFLSLFTFGIGWLWLDAYVNAAEAAFYLDMTGRVPGNEGKASV